MTSTRELFWILTVLMLSPTYDFLQPELEIKIKPNGIQLTVRTEYLPDFLRVRTASRMIGRQLVGQVKLSYQANAVKTTADSAIKFFDSYNGITGWLISDIPIPKGIVQDSPSNSMDIDERIRRDSALS